MLMRSGGRLSVIGVPKPPMSSRSLFVAHRAPVVGLNASPTELRSPRANTRPPVPLRLYRITAARTVSLSVQMLHDDPIDTYIMLSGPKTTVRVEWPVVEIFETSCTGVATPGS